MDTSDSVQKYRPFLTPEDEGFKKLHEKYPDFLHLPKKKIPQDLAEDVAWAFNKLESEGFFYRHWVMVQGKHVLTPVSRTLVGDPGMTYRYLGLRIFSLPWSFGDRKDLTEIEQACSIICKLNQFLKSTSCQVLNSRLEATGDWRNADDSSSQRNAQQTARGASDISRNASEEPAPSLTPTHQLELRDARNLHVECGENLMANDSTGQKSRIRETEQANENRQSEPDFVKNKTKREETENSSTSDNDGPPSKRRRQEARAETIEEGTDFSVALINYMDPLDWDLNLKPEPYYGMGPMAVPWHMDGNLLRGSTVAVYSYTCETSDDPSDKSRDWMVGIRKAWDEESPGLAAPLASGDAYFMLADLNDTSRHCVIAGDQPRFASTHRVVDSSRGTLQYIQGRCQLALNNLEQHMTTTAEGGGGPKTEHSLLTLGPGTIALTEEIHNEVEFEWLRQFWMQGTRHAAERTYWTGPMEGLEKSWELMEIMTKLAVEAGLCEETPVDEAQAVISVLLPHIETRDKLRCEWTNRYSGDVILSMEPDRMPLYRPTWDDHDLSRPLPFTLTKIIKQLRSKQSRREKDDDSG